MGLGKTENCVRLYAAAMVKGRVHEIYDDKAQRQQAYVQNIFYELRAAGLSANESAAAAIERAIGGGRQGAGGE